MAKRKRKSSVETKWLQPRPPKRKLFPYRDIEIIAIQRRQAELRRQLVELTADKRRRQRRIYIKTRRLDPEFREAEKKRRKTNARDAAEAAATAGSKRRRSIFCDLNDS